MDLQMNQVRLAVHLPSLEFVECTVMAYDFQVSWGNSLTLERVQRIQAKETVDMVVPVMVSEHMNLDLV